MYARTQIIGFLGKDPEMRYTPSGIAVTNFSVATSQTWTGKDGQRNEKTIWYRIVAWQKLADICNQYLRKGHKVFVEGEMEECRVWTGQDGNARADLELRARDVRFLTSKAEAESMGAPGYGSGGQQSNTQQSNTQPSNAQQNNAQQAAGGGNYQVEPEEEIPF